MSQALIGWTIDLWRWFWRPPDSKLGSTNGSAWCTTTHRQWSRWKAGIRRVHNRAVSPSRLSLVSSYILALELLLPRLRGGAANPTLRDTPLLTVLGSLRTLMMSPYLCPVDRTYKQGRRKLKGVNKYQVSRWILIRVKVCGWVPWWVDFSCQDTFGGVRDSAASSGCCSGPAYNWSEIGQRFEPR